MELDLFHNSQTNETRFKQTKRESQTNKTRFKRTNRDSQTNEMRITNVFHDSQINDPMTFVCNLTNTSCYRGGSGNLLSMRGIRLEWERMETWISSLVICTLYCFHTIKWNEL